MIKAVEERDVEARRRMATSSAVRLDALRKDFGGITAVKDVDLEIERGERVGVIGPNGAGKTTLFRLVAGDESPTGGRVLLDGKDVTRLPAHARSRLGLGRTFQITNLFPSLTVQENLLLAARHHRGREADERVRDVAADFGLSGQLSQPVATMSYGEQRRMELALALCADVHLLLLDEPAAGLGPGDRQQMQDLIDGLDPALTILLIEHDMDLALELVDRVICMHQGAVVADEPSDTVHEHPVIRQIYLGDPIPEAS